MHAVLLAHGKPCPVTDLFGVRGRQLLDRLGLPEPWQGTIEASLRLIDELDREIGGCELELRRLGADHRTCRYSAPSPGSAGCSPTRSPPRSATSAASPVRANSPATPALPARLPIRRRDLRGPLAKQGPRYLRWALVEAATTPAPHPIYRDRYQHTKARIGKQRGAKVAQIDLARRLTEAIGTCSPAANPSLPKAPPTPWPPDGP